MTQHSIISPAKARQTHYSIENVTPGILHFGVGNFHRSHQAVYIDKLMELNGDLKWGIVGAGVMPSDHVLRDTLHKQNYLTTVVEESATLSQLRVIASMTGFLPVGNATSIISTIANPQIEIVSLTVTEGGYFIDTDSGEFDTNHPDIQFDTIEGSTPKTVFGLILAGLARRRETGNAPLTVMSCDNIPDNGGATKNAVLGIARQQDQALSDWVEEHVSFPSSMVDRITPATGELELQRIKNEFGIDDQAPVFCEDFSQWVLEDKFAGQRPALEQVGVEFTNDVSPFENMKLRILNGGHASIAYPAALMGFVYVADAMADPLISGFLDKLHKREIIPSVLPVQNTNLHQYAEKVVERFSRPRIVDTIDRLCYDGKNRQPKFILPTIRDRLAKGEDINGLALVSALWCRYCQGHKDDGSKISSNDPAWPTLSAAAKAAQKDPLAWLVQSDIYADLGEHPDFIWSFTHALESVTSKGTRESLRVFINHH